jgi:hypothetical protein
MNLFKEAYEPGVVMHAYNPSTWEAEAGGGFRVQGHTGYIMNFRPVWATHPDPALQKNIKNAIFILLKKQTWEQGISGSSLSYLKG